MPLSIFRKGNAVGVSISDGSIEICEVSPAAGGAFAARTLARRPLESGVLSFGRVLDVDKLAAALRATAAAAQPHSLSTATVDIVIPDAATYFHIFTLPGSLSDQEIAKALPFASEELIPFPPEDLVGDFRVISRNAGETTVVYAVALREVVKSYATAVTKAGLRAGRFLLEADTLASSLLSPAKKDTADVVIDIGDRSSVVFVRDTFGLRATFSEPIAGGHITQAVAKATGLSLEKSEVLKRKIGLGKTGDAAPRKAIRQTTDALFARLSRVFVWYERLPAHGTIANVILTGGTSDMPGLVEELATVVHAKRPKVLVGKGNPFKRLQVAPLTNQIAKRNELSYYAPAVGAALLVLERNPTFDFLNPSRAASSMFRGTSRPSSRPTVLAGVSPKAKVGAAEPDVIEEAEPSPSMRDRWEDSPQKGKTILAALFMLIAMAGLVGAIWYRVNLQRQIEADIQAVLEGRAAASQQDTVEAITQPVIISSNAEQADVAARHVETASASRTIVITPSGTGETENVPAELDVVLSNTSANDVALIARTRLLSPDGVLYRLREPVTVRAGGTAQALAVADVAGPESALTEPTRFTLPGLPASQQESVFAASNGPSTPGTAVSAAITQEDIDMAVEALRAAVRAEAPNLLKDLLEEGEMVFDVLVHVTVEPVDLPEAGAIAASLEGTMNVRIDALVLSESALMTYARNVLMARSGLSAETIDGRGDVRYTLQPGETPYAGGDDASLSLTIGLYPHDTPSSP